jgi:dimethylargininase
MTGIALVRRPGPLLAEGIVTHIERSPVDPQRALDQWRRYVEVLGEHGWSVCEVAPEDGCPDAVFVEDAVVMFDRLAVITHPGSPVRRAETDAIEPVARSLGLDVGRIGPAGTLDGGDVLKVGRTAFVGRSGRTDQAGIDELRALVGPRGWTVVAVPLTKVLHLKSAVTALPDGTIIGWPPVVDDPGVFDRFLPMPEEAGAHVVDLGDALMVSAAAPRSAALLRSMGYTVVAVDISEFERLEGCVTCLSVRVRALG